MMGDQVVAHLFAHQGDQPLADRERQDVAIGHRRQHPLGRLEAGDDLLQRVLAEIGVVVGAGGDDGAIPAVLGDGVGDLA